MRKVELNMKEELKYKVIKDLVDKGSDGNKKRAAVKLGCTIRTINRLIVLIVQLNLTAALFFKFPSEPLSTKSLITLYFNSSFMFNLTFLISSITS